MNDLSPETQAFLLVMAGLFVLGAFALAVLLNLRVNRVEFLDGDRRQLPSPNVARLDDYRRAYAAPLSDQHREPYETVCDECGAELSFVPSHEDGPGAVGPLFRCQRGHAWREVQGIIFLDFTREPASDVVSFTTPHGAA